jgi:hypothetical protein
MMQSTILVMAAGFLEYICMRVDTQFSMLMGAPRVALPQFFKPALTKQPLGRCFAPACSGLTVRGENDAGDATAIHTTDSGLQQR